MNNPPPVTYLTHRTTLSIGWGHCDPAGIVFNSRFFEFFDAGLWDMFQTALGIPRHKIMGHYGVIGFPLVEAGGEFIMPLKFGDEAELASTVSEFRRSSFDVSHRITIGGKLAVDGFEKRVWVNRDPDNPVKMKSAPIPPDLIERLTIK